MKAVLIEASSSDSSGTLLAGLQDQLSSSIARFDAAVVGDAGKGEAMLIAPAGEDIPELPSEINGFKVISQLKLETVFPENEQYWLDIPKRVSAPLFCAFIFVHVTAGSEEQFKKASMDNAANSQQESGVLKFDLLQHSDDSSRFILREIYVDDDAAPKAHKETAHYARWRDTVADMMASPRAAIKTTIHDSPQ